MNSDSPSSPIPFSLRHLRTVWYLFCFLTFSTFAVAPASAQNSPELLKNKAFIHDVQAAIDSVYNMNYEASLHILAPWQKKYPDNPLWMFWKGLHTWWLVLPDLEDKQYDKQLVYDFSQANYRCSRLLNKDPKNLDALLIKSASDAFLARFYANRDNWLKAFQYGKTSISTVFVMQDDYPHFSDLGFGLGAYNFYSAWLPEQYPVLKSLTWLLPKGSKSKGLHMLRDAADSSVLVKPEAIYTLGRVYLEAEQKPDSALYYFRKLTVLYPQNLYYQILYVYTLFREGHYPEVLTDTQKFLAKEPEISKERGGQSILEHLFTVRAMAYYDIGDYGETIYNCQKGRNYSLLSPEGKNRYNYALCGYLLGKTYENMGNVSKAKEYFKETARLKSDSPYIEQAQKNLKKLREHP